MRVGKWAMGISAAVAAAATFGVVQGAQQAAWPPAVTPGLA